MMMKKPLISILAVVLVLFGVLFFLQGIGLMKGTPMSDQALWVIVGPIVLVAGIGLLWFGNRRASV